VKYICIDYGLARIGVAASDNGILARPLTVIQNKGDKKNLTALRNIFGGMGGEPQNIVVGKGFSGAVEFGNLLQREFGNVIFADENFTSIEAEQYIRNVMGVTDIKKIKDLIDMAAAVMILNSYIQKGEK
jgi:putative transcription antitermination factor YqgF